MSDTPRTDNWLDTQPPTLFLARRQMEHLERELNSAKAENEAMLECLEALLSWEPRQKDEGEREAYIIARTVFDKIASKKKEETNA